MIKVIIFDIGGVLEKTKYAKVLKGRHRTGIHSYIAKRLDIGVDLWFEATDPYFALSSEGKISKKKFTSIISKNLKTTEGKLRRIILSVFKKLFKHNKILYNTAFKLKKQGYKIAILSNQWHFSKEALIKKKYVNRFDVVVISCDVGVRKPNIKIYKMILKKLKIPGRECIFIDNEKWNLPPAKKLGIKTILFKNNSQLIKDLKKLKVKIQNGKGRN